MSTLNPKDLSALRMAIFWRDIVSDAVRECDNPSLRNGLLELLERRERNIKQIQERKRI